MGRREREGGRERGREEEGRRKGGRGGRERGEGRKEGRKGGRLVFQVSVPTMWTHSDKGHFGLVTKAVVSSLQFLGFLKYRNKEVDDLRWFEGYINKK